MSQAPLPREPMINAPAPVLAVVASILLSYLLESLAPDPTRVQDMLGLSSSDLLAGRVWTLLTVVIVHANWAHAGLNALGALAFGTPAARALGPRGGGRFIAFYLLCALAASFGYPLVHWGGDAKLVGASGGISGLMGAASRLVDRGERRLARLRSRTVLAMGGAWIAINLLMALGWIDVGSGGAPIAWEAHLAGYLAGVLLIGPFLGPEPSSPVPA